jgi:hypothetical protein
MEADKIDFPNRYLVSCECLAKGGRATGQSDATSHSGLTIDIERVLEVEVALKRNPEIPDAELCKR